MSISSPPCTHRCTHASSTNDTNDLIARERRVVARIGHLQHRVGQLYLRAVAALATGAAAVRIFPHENGTGCPISEAGLIAASSTARPVF